jgi:geranylgeranyl reductase family protein
VIGAGPAGAMCALSLARAGHRCLVIDRAQFPRHKPCGDLLLSDAQSALDQAGLLSAVRNRALALRAIRVYSPSRIEFEIPGQYLVLRRYDFDALLMAAAVESGAVFLHASACDMRNQDDQVTVNLLHSGCQIRARFAALATGAVVTLPRHLGMISRDTPDAMAIRCYVRSESPLDQVILSYDRALVPGYGWIVPVGEGVFNVGCGVVMGAKATPMISLKQMLRRFVDEFPPARDIMRTGRYLSPPQGAALRCGLSGFRTGCVGRMLGIGEVVGTTFPFTGAGIGKAMFSGILAAEVLDTALRSGANDLGDEYASRLERELHPLYDGYAMAQRWLSRPWLNDFMARRVRKSAYMQREVAALLGASGDPRGLFSLTAILKSCWS